MRVLAVIALVAWIMAFGRSLLNLAFIPRLRSGKPGRGPLVSVIIPARDEARAIERSVRAWLGQRYHDLQIIVVNDRSTDATEAILNRLAAESPHLTVVHGEEPPPGWLGKPWALHEGSGRARGELLLFVDADVIYAPDAVGAAVALIEQRQVALIALLPHIEMKGFWEHVAMPALGVTLFMILPTWFANRTRFAWGALGGGTGNLVRRADYDAAGGHEALKATVVDDVGLARLLRRHGRRTLAVRADDHVRLRMYHGGGEIVRGFTKNMFSAMGRSYAFALSAIVILLICNLPPYVFALMGDPISIGTVSLITASRLLVFSSLRYRLDNALLGQPISTLFWCYVVMRSLWITGIRGRVVWRGRAYDATGLQGIE